MLQKLRDRLVSYSREIDENIRDVERLCDEGAETLSPEQFHALKENRQKLQSMYESLIRQTDALLDRLDVATALLIEFSTKSSQLQSWIFDKSRSIDRIRAECGDPTSLTSAKQLVKQLDEDIQCKQTDLKSIGQLAAKIDVEICRYVDELRRRDTQSPTTTTTTAVVVPVMPQLDRNQIVETVDRVQDDYLALIRAKNDLAQFVNRLKSFATLCEQNLNEVNVWLAALENTIADPETSAAVDLGMRFYILF